MNILIIINPTSDSKSIAGVMYHYCKVANIWIEQGHSVSFLVAKVSWPQLQAMSPKASLLSSDSLFQMNVNKVGVWLNFAAYAYRMLNSHWQRLSQRYDVIYSSSQVIFDVYPALVLSKRYHAGFAVKVHHMLRYQQHRGGFIDNLFLRAEKISTRIMNRFAKAIICNNRTVAEDYGRLEAELGLPMRETAKIGCGIDSGFFQKPTSGPKLYDAIYLGRLHRHKGALELPDIWERVTATRPDAKLLVVGAGPERQTMENMFSQKGLEKNVTFAGAVSDQEKVELLHQSRIGLSTSFEEGWGITIMEFMASKLPVIAYYIPVFDEVFPNQLICVEKGDRNAMAEKIIELLADPCAQQIMGERVQEFVKKYDYETVAARELDLLKTISQS